MRRPGLFAAAFLAACAVPTLLLAQRAAITGNTFSNESRPPESGPFSFTVTVTNTNATAGYFSLQCAQLSSQLPCGTVSPSTDVYLAYNQSQVYTVTFSTLGTGNLNQRYRAYDGLSEAITKRDSLTVAVPVAGGALQTHLSPVENQILVSSDSLSSLFQSASGINTVSLKLLIDGTDYTASSQVIGTTIRRNVSGVGAGTHRFTSYGCTSASPARCDSLSTNFGVIGIPGPIALDDSLPAPDGEGHFGTLPGALPLPPENLRGCPVNQGDPDIALQTPGLMVYQPTNPAGYMFWAGLVWDNVITIAASTADNVPSNPRHCSILPWVTDTGFDWNYWLHSDPDDPLWDSYPYGDRGGPQLRALPTVAADATVALSRRRRGGGHVRGELSDLDPQHPLFAATRAYRAALRTSTTPVTQPSPGSVSSALMPLLLRAAGDAPRPPAVRSKRPGGEVIPDGGPLPNIIDAGAIKPSSYWVTLNGTYIVQNGAPVYSGVASQYLAASGSSFTIPTSAAIVNRYSPANPGSSPNGGWNELIASISDSTNHWTSVRVRFAVIDPGSAQDLALTPLRNYQRHEEGDCAAFGSFQCGSNTLVQTIPGFVTRDRDRSLHLVYRSASQRAPMVLPYQMAVDRYQMAPDSVRAWITQGGANVSDTVRYAGTKCSPACPTYQLLDELANEWRVIGAQLPAPASGDAFTPLTMNIRGYYLGTVHDNANTVEIPRLYWSDTTSTRFGAGWQLAELGRLLFFYPASGSTAIYARGDGSYTVFRYQGSQVWAGPPGSNVRMVERNDADGSVYHIEFPNGTAVGFLEIGAGNVALQRNTRDLIGNRTTYGYAGNRLTYIQDPNGIWYDFLYDGTGRVSEIRVQRPSGSSLRLATFGYSSGNLGSLALWTDDSHSETTQFTYQSGAPGAYLSSVTDPRGNVTNFSYDPRFWTPISMVRPPYLAVRDTAYYRDPLRRSAPREGYGRLGCTPSACPQERLPYLNQARGTYLGIATTPTDVEVDAFGSPTMVRHFAPPMPPGWQYPQQADELRHIDRDSVGRVLKIVAGRDYYAANADSVRYQYDAHGNLSRLIRTTAQFPTAGIAFDTTSYTYDSVTTGLPFTGQRCVRLRTMRDAMAGADSVNYGGSGAGQCLPTRMRGMAGDTTAFSYSLSLGNTAGVRPVTVVDATGLRQDMTYDATTWNSATSVRYADGATSRAHYDYYGRPDSVNDAVGTPTVMRRDRLGRVLFARTGTGAKAPVTASYYGAGGLVDSVRIYGTTGAVDAAPTTAVQTTRYKYNALGWVDTTFTPAGRKQYARHDRAGRPYFEYTGQGGFIARLYDFAGRITTESQSEVRPGYSVDGLQFADAATTSLYNSYGLREPVTLSAGVGHFYNYDERGRLVTMNDPGVQTTQRSFAPGGALTYESVAFSDGATVRRRFEYNRRGQRTVARDSAFVTASGSFLGAQRIDYAYSAAAGRLDSVIGYRDGTRYAAVGYRFDLAGRDTLHTVTISSSSQSHTVTTQTQYDGAGRRSVWQQLTPAGTWSNMDNVSYGLNDELLSFHALEPGAYGGPENRISTNNTLGYSSDGTRRLLSSVRSGGNDVSSTWRYDVFGNRQFQQCTSTMSLCANLDTTTYGADNRIVYLNNTGGVARRSTAYWHDNAGNRLAQVDSSNGSYIGYPSGIMSYTARGQLYFSMTPTARAGDYDYNWHYYNGAGLRVISHVQTGSTWSQLVKPDSSANRTYYVYDGSDVSMTLVRNNGAWRVHQRFLVGGVDQPLAGWFSTSSGASSKALAFLTDYQGSVRAAVGADGLRESTAAYWSRDPFGALQGNSGATDGATVTGTGYTGASSPNATGGFTYLRNRWYDPQTGRFLTQDPIGLAGGVNLYAYAGGNPVAFSDPFGLCPKPPCRSDDDPLKDRPLPDGVDPNHVTWEPGLKGNGEGGYREDAPGTRLILPHTDDKKHWEHWDVVEPGPPHRQYQWPEMVMKPGYGPPSHQSPVPPTWPMSVWDRIREWARPRPHTDLDVPLRPMPGLLPVRGLPLRVPELSPIDPIMGVPE